MRDLTLSIIALLIFYAFSGHAAIKTEDQDIKPVFILISSGEQLSAVKATEAAIKGERVLKCQEVEAHASRTGNINLKKKN